MLRLDPKAKHYVFENMINDCKHNNFEYTPSFNKDGYITTLKITHNNIDYIVSDIGIMGVSLLVVEDSNVSVLWNIQKLFEFIKSNNC